MVDEMNVVADEAVVDPAEGMSKAERKAAYKDQSKKIAGLARGVEKELKEYKKAASKLDKTYDANERAQAALALKPNKAKRQLAAVKAEEAYNADLFVFKGLHEQIDADVAAIEVSYDALASYAWNMKLKFKAGEEFTKYKFYIEERKEKAQRPIAEIMHIIFPVEEAPVEEAPVEEAPAEPTVEEKLAKVEAAYEELLRRMAQPAFGAPTVQYVMAPPAPYGYPQAPQAQPEVKVAPVQVDVSKAVAKAVDAIMDKLGAALDEKLAAYAASMPAVAGAANLGPAAEAVAQVSEDEAFLLEKVTAVVEKVQAMTDTLMAMNEVLAEAAKKQGEISEQQK